MTRKTDVNNRNLISQIDKMLALKHRKVHMRENALLGFCARLFALRPQASSHFKNRLKKRLLQHSAFCPKKIRLSIGLIFSLRAQARPSALLGHCRRFWGKTAPFLIPIGLFLFCLNPTVQTYWPSTFTHASSLTQDRSGQKNGPMALEPISPHSIFGPHPVQGEDLKIEIQTKILNTYQSFRLIEYTLLDGSRIKVLESILF